MRLLLGVVLLGGAAAAQAQTVIWESQLTVGTSGTVSGYATGTPSYGSLTTLSFSFKGATPTVTGLSSDTSGTVLRISGLSGQLGTTNWTLHIGTTTFPVADAFANFSGQIAWHATATWSSGDTVAVKLTTTEPGAPTGVTAMRTGATTVRLGWTAPTSIGGSAITKYQYRQKSGTGSYGSWSDILNSASLTSYDVTVQAAIAAHTFQLRAVNTAGAGLWSDEALSQLIQIDSIAFNSAGSDNTFYLGDAVTATVTFSEAATVTGTPQLTIDVGGADKVLSYSSGSGSTALVFTGYTVASGDADTDGLSIDANQLTLNSGTIKASGGGGPDAVLTTLPWPPPQATRCPVWRRRWCRSPRLTSR